MDAINTGKINQMHIPMVLYGYIIQASSLPFTTQHSPSLQRTISIVQTKTTARVQYRKAAKNSTTTTGTASQGN